MANINDLGSELTDFYTSGNRLYVVDNDGVATDKYIDVAKYGDHYELLTSFSSALKFDKNYTIAETNAYNLASGDLTLTLEGVHTPILGKRNIIRVIADNVHSINLSADFDSNGIYPDQLDGAILASGTYILETWYDTDGICIEAKKFLTAAVQPPVILNAYIDNLTANWNFVFNEPVTLTSAGFTLKINAASTVINTVNGSGTTTIEMITNDTPIATDICNFDYAQITGDCISVLTGAELQDINNRLLQNDLVSDDDIQLISGLEIYLLASDINGDNTNNSGYSDGQQVASWIDKSTNGNNATQSNVALRPVYREELDIGQGNPVITFTEDEFDLAYTVSGNFTICFAAKTASKTKNIIAFPGIYTTTSGVVFDGTSTRTLNSADVLTDIFFVSYDGSNLKLYLNDDVAATDTSSFTASFQMTLGTVGRDASPEDYDGSMAAMVHFSKELSSGERETVYDTLVAKLNWI